MRTLDEIMGRCVPDEITGCMVYAGFCDKKFGPRVYAPDLADGGKLKTMWGRRAVWQLATGKALPNGWRVYGTCGNQDCLEFKHMQAMTSADYGKRVADSGKQKGRITRITANRKISRGRTRLTPELISLIVTSPKTGIELVAELGIGRSTISKVRTGQFKALAPVGGIFSGLLT